MRLVLTAMLAVLAVGCRRPSPPPPSAPGAAPPQCSYEIIKPDTSPAALAFRAWLKPKAGDLFGRDEVVESGDVFIADLNNDGTDEVMFAWHEGSGSYLNVLVYRGAAGKWVAVDPLPFEDQLEASHEYSGPLMTEPQLVARLCGKTIINLMGGIEPNYY